MPAKRRAQLSVEDLEKLTNLKPRTPNSSHIGCIGCIALDAEAKCLALGSHIERLAEIAADGVRRRDPHITRAALTEIDASSAKLATYERTVVMHTTDPKMRNRVAEACLAAKSAISRLKDAFNHEKARWERTGKLRQEVRDLSKGH